MTPKINRILITLICLVFIVSAPNTRSVAQNAIYRSFTPLITNNPTSWLGPFGGTIVSIAFDPANPSIVYAGSYGSGVYKSLDSGLSWTSASRGLTNLYIYSMAVDPQQPSTLYAGTYRSQIYKSTDGGGTWTWSGTGMQAQAIVYSIAIDPVTTNIIYASTRGVSNNGNPPWNGVLYKSSDGGTTWVSVLDNLGGADLQDWVYSVLVNPHAHKQVLIAAHETGPLQSNDSGLNWYSINNGILDNSGRAIAVGLQEAFASNYYFGVWHVDSIYKSTNNGISWVPINQGIPYEHVYNIALDPQNGNNIYLATFKSGVLKSNNGGTSWQSSGLALDNVFSVILKPGLSSYMLASTEGDGLYQSGNSGSNWSHSSTGIENTMATSVVLSPIDSHTIYTSMNGAGVYQSVDKGKNWSDFNLGLSDRFVLDMIKDPGHPGLIYVLTNEGGLFKNDLNTGIGWISTGDGLPIISMYQPAFPTDHPFATFDINEASGDGQSIESSSPSTYAPLLKMVFASSNPQIAYIGTSGKGIYRSNDGGQTWQTAGLSPNSVSSLAVDWVNPNLVYAVTDLGGSIRVTNGNWSNWQYFGLPQIFYSVVASPTQSGVAYLGTTDGVYRFEYPSGVFTSLGLNGQTVTAIQLDPFDPNIIYAGTNQTAYYTVDSGQTWNLVSDDLSGVTTYSISLDSIVPNLIYFNTTTHGIFLMTSR
jgi:photosystem II stability/assembly factor-like uncharacterized protein